MDVIIRTLDADFIVWNLDPRTSQSMLLQVGKCKAIREALDQREFVLDLAAIIFVCLLGFVEFLLRSILLESNLTLSVMVASLDAARTHVEKRHGYPVGKGVVNAMSMFGSSNCERYP